MHRSSMLAGTAALVLTLGLSSTALAAEPAAPAAITVQLDGQALTGAVPQVVDSRTFLPIRAVFEAMGATVDYSAADQTITAVRGGTSITMGLDNTTATVDQSGVKTQLTMDAAPYATDGTTYVPVRFAAQAFGCGVGWDQAKQTVIIVDNEKLADSALTDNQYTYLDKYAEYAARYTQGNWAMKGDFTGDMTMMGMGPAAISGTIDGLTADTAKIELNMGMKMDLKKLMEDMSAMAQQTLTEADMAILDPLMDPGMTIQMRGDMGDGTLYMLMGLPEAIAASAGMDSKTWYSMDINEALAGTGMDMGELIAASKELNARSTVLLALTSAKLDDSTTAYTTASDLAKTAASAVADSAFVKDGSNVVMTQKYTEDGTDSTTVLTLNMKDDKVVGYTMKMDAATQLDAGAADTMPMGTSMTMSVDEKDHCVIDLSMDMGIMDMNIQMTVDYTTTDKVPSTQPPEGATVQPFVAPTA